MNRRNILTIMGLAAASTPALAAEHFDTFGPPAGVPGLWQAGYDHRPAQEKLAVALENMAKAIRSGELTGVEIDINSKIKPDSWIEHEVRILCEIVNNERA